MKIAFRCGHKAQIDPDKTPSPQCLRCGEKRVAYTVNVGPPRITGHARGPHVVTSHLGPMAVDLTTKGALPLKEPTHASE